jgi:hypothetical protein
MGALSDRRPIAEIRLFTTGAIGNFASFPQIAYGGPANVVCDGYGVMLRLPNVPSQLAEARTPQPCGVAVYMIDRIPI